MVLDRWLVIILGEQAWLWNLGQAEQDELVDLVNAARVIAGFPASDDWSQDPAGRGMSVAFTFGEPHHTMMARATVGTVEQLRGVDRAKVRAHARARELDARAARIASAKAAFGDMAPAELDEVFRHRPDVTVGGEPDGDLP
jgi:hypothetical protein